MAGSTADLADAGLNADLFYRLQVSSVRIPSLAERPEDIPVLFRHYVAQASEQAGLHAPDITPQAITGLMAQDWPGNTRALMSAAMRFALDMTEDVAPQDGLGLAEQLAQVERSLLEAALRRSGGQASAAARALKLPRKTFYDKLARYRISPESFRR
jgi:two-component system C4-dicarboxylate transport response regulator DctD